MKTSWPSVTSRANPNRLFGRLGIRLKLAIAFLLLSITPLAIVGWYTANQQLRSLRTSVTAEQQHHLTQLQGQVETLLRTVGEDLDFVSKSGSVTRLLARDDSSDRESLIGTLGDLLASKPYYYRIRLLLASGEELAHVLRVPGGSRVVRDADWRRTGYRYYRTLLTEGNEDSDGGVRLVPVELRDRSTPGPNAEMRLVPAFSFVTPVPAEDRQSPTLLVADVFAREILRLVQGGSGVRSETVMLVGPGGHYVYHSAKKTDWNTLLATQHEQTLAGDFPPTVVDQILSGAAGILEPPGWVIVHAPLFARGQSPLGRYVLVSAVRSDVAFASVRRVVPGIVAIGALTLIIAGVLAFFAAHQFTSPIRDLRRAAARLSTGDFEARVRVDTNDELEELADTFASMASALKRHEASHLEQSGELERYAHELESMVDERTRELRVSQRGLVQQEKMVAVGQLAAGVAHELGSPLGAILLHADMVLEDIKSSPGPNSPRLEKSLAVVLDQAERTREIVRNLLDFSRPSTDEFSCLDLREVINFAADLVRHDLKKRSIALDVGRLASPATVRGNLNNLQQLVVNLLRNGADAMENGGEISVRVSAEQDDEGLWAVLRVGDEGCGIPAAIANRIFEPFFTTKPPGIGTGLGLWISYNIVAEHRGSLTVESTDETGTTVRVRLPANTMPEESE